jgi:CheY-like chemotaxis protein
MVKCGLNIKNVLLVEDNTLTLILLESQLVKHGISVVKAMDGGAGWEACLEKEFDLLIIDINIPVMNGKQLLTKIKSDLSRSQGKKIAISSGLSKADFNELLKLGFDACLNKPIHIKKDEEGIYIEGN